MEYYKKLISAQNDTIIELKNIIKLLKEELVELKIKMNKEERKK